MVTGLGAGAEAVFEALVAGRSAISRAEVDGLGEVAAGRVPDEAADADERFGRRAARRMDRASRLAALAADDALADAGRPDIDPTRIGAAIGSAHGGAGTIALGQSVLEERGADRVGPLTIPLGLVNAPAASVARTAGLRGPSLAPATACAAGADAIGQAMLCIRDGRADAMVAGGADAPLVPVVIAGYRSAGALAQPGDAPVEAPLAAVRSRCGRASSSPRARPRSCSRSASMRWRGAHASMPSCSATARAATPDT